MMRTFLPLRFGELQGSGGVGLARRPRPGRASRPAGRAFSGRSGRSRSRRCPRYSAGGGAEPVHVPSAFQRETIGSRAGGRPANRGRPSGPSARAGLIRSSALLVFADRMEDLDLRGQRWNLVGLFLHGLPRRCSRRSHNCGPPDGPGPAPRDASWLPWRTGRRRDRYHPGPAAEGPPARPARLGFGAGTGQFLECADLLGELGLIALGGVGQAQRVGLLLLLDGNVWTSRVRRSSVAAIRSSQSSYRVSSSRTSGAARCAGGSRRRWGRSSAGRAVARPGCGPRRSRRGLGRYG